MRGSVRHLMQKVISKARKIYIPKDSGLMLDNQIILHMVCEDTGRDWSALYSDFVYKFYHVVFYEINFQ